MRRFGPKTGIIGLLVALAGTARAEAPRTLAEFERSGVIVDIHTFFTAAARAGNKKLWYIRTALEPPLGFSRLQAARVNFIRSPAHMTRTSGHRAIVLMGVCGSGKTTIGRLLSQQAGWPFYDGDDFHPRANVEKMGRGEPLTDADRLPWLRLLSAQLDKWLTEGNVILACSALKEHYRQVLLGARPQVCLVYLKGTRELIGQRLAGRAHRYMPARLLDSQFAALEEPARALVVEVSSTPEAAVAQIRRGLGI